MAEKYSDQDFVEFVVKQIVTDPVKVEVERSIDEMGVLITLKVGLEDMGKIIGKEGKTAKALRTLLRVIGSKNDERVNLKILEPEGSDRVAKEVDAPRPVSAEPVEKAETVVEEIPATPQPIAEEPKEIPIVPEDDTEEKATALI